MHFVCSEDLYGGSVRIFETVGKSRGLSFTYVNTSHQELVEQALT
ncbi:MAG: PLP-dependent transferase [Acetatifactor sp.]|nr:PLP-dependent transferase [Acetatifactor sp.]